MGQHPLGRVGMGERVADAAVKQVNLEVGGVGSVGGIERVDRDLDTFELGF